MALDGCQFDSLLSMGQGTAHTSFEFYMIKLGRFVKRHVSKRRFEAMKRSYLSIRGLFSKKRFSKQTKNNAQTEQPVNKKRDPLKAGDRVRVRSLEEIEATLDQNRKTYGCAFLKTQEQYCGSVQRVYKSIERFVDERDFKVKKSKGMVLLEGVICDGNDIFGRCDRSCLLFWREEWLDKLE